MTLILHPQLASDCFTVGDMPLCQILLMNHRHFPWLILVPRRDGLRELYDLSEADYHTCMQEIRHTAQAFAALTSAHKMNIAALGNQVAQLHIHIIARFTQDAAWPNPVWNCGVKAEPYEAEALKAHIADIRKQLGL